MRHDSVGELLERVWIAEIDKNKGRKRPKGGGSQVKDIAPYQNVLDPPAAASAPAALRSHLERLSAFANLQGAVLFARAQFKILTAAKEQATE